MKTIGKRFYWLFLLFLCYCSPDSNAPAHSVYTVEIKQMQFQPAQLEVKKGDTVVFVNHDIVMHNVTEQTNKSWASPTLQNDSSWKWVATQSAAYYCTLHPVMKGKVTVK
ncbi:MAG: plastocyanin/azurin family copper-binding protein [Flavisolibacter sp.]